MTFKHEPVHDKQLIDYLDGSLDDQTRQSIDDHLSRCPECRKKLEAQRQWLALRKAHLPPAGWTGGIQPEQLNKLNRQISQTIHAKALADAQASAERKTFWRRPVFWQQTACAAVIVVLLVVSVPLFQSFINKQSDATLPALAELFNTAAGSKAGGEKELGVDSDRTAALATIWQVHTGSLTNIAAVHFLYDCAQVSDASDQTRTDATGSAAVEQVPDPSDEMTAETEQSAGAPNDAVNGTVRDFFAPESTSLSAEGQQMYALLCQAESIRVFTRSDSEGQALVLAAYPSVQIEDYRESYLNILNTCQTPFKIEIIRTQDLPGQLETLEKGLYGRAFTEQPAVDVSWIFILIGA